MAKPYVRLEPLERRCMLSAHALKFTYTDTDGDVATISLSGGGNAAMLPGALPQLNVSDTTARSALTVSVRRARGGDGYLTLGRLWSSGPLKSINAPRANLTGTLLLDTNDGDMGASSITIRLRALDNANADTHNLPINSMTVTDWRNSDLFPESFATPWIGKLTVTGRGKSLRGDLDVDMTLTGRDAVGTALGTLSVAGVWTGDLLADGNLGLLKIGRNMASSQVRTSGAIKNVQIAGDMADSRLQSGGSIGAITVSSLAGSQILVGVAHDFAGQFASSPADFANPAASLGSLRMRMPTRRQPAYVQETGISAPATGSVTWVNVQPETCYLAILANPASKAVVKVVSITKHAVARTWRYGQPNPPAFVALLA